MDSPHACNLIGCLIVSLALCAYALAKAYLANRQIDHLKELIAVTVNANCDAEAAHRELMHELQRERKLAGHLTLAVGEHTNFTLRE